MNTANKYEQWASNKFQGLTKAELREAGSIFGCTFGPNAGEAAMRQKLCEKIGEAPMREPEVIKPRTDGKKPNLTPKGVWEGRRQRVILSRAPHEAQHKAKALIWEGETRYFAYDEIVDMPQPWFNIMVDAVSAHVYQKPLRDEEGNLLGYQRIETPYSVHQYRHLGVTPGTEDLPIDLCDYWKQQAQKTDYFARYSRAALIKINSDFIGSVGIQHYKDTTTEEIRLDVLRRCNLEDIVLELEQQAAALPA